jgi:predicted NUDIX family NTP pyrophosphohydrolase
MDRAAWVTVEAAETLLVKSQVPILDALRKFLL